MFNQYIYTFVEVAESGSLSAASKNLYISKVSVMNQINSLEKRIGAKLLKRNYSGVSLTEVGKLFYENIKKLLLQSENIIQEVQLASGNKNQVIRIGTSLMRPCDSFITDFENKYKETFYYTFTIVTFNDEKDGLSSMLKSLGKRIDCFLSPVGSEWIKNEYGFLPIGTCNHIISLPKSHKLSKKKILTWKDLENEKLLLLKKGRSYITDAIREDIENNHPKITIIDIDKYYDISTFNLCDQKGFLLDSLEIWRKTHPSLVMIPVKWKYKIPYGIIFSKKPSKKVKKIIDSVANILRPYET